MWLCLLAASGVTWAQQASESTAAGSASPGCESSLTALNKGLSERSAVALFEAAAVLDAGRCVKRDEAQAAQYLKEAAKRGNRQAALRLARKFGRGSGVPQSYANAGAWTAGKGVSDEPIEAWDFSIGFAYTLLSEVLAGVDFPALAAAGSKELHFVVEIDARQPARINFRRTSPAVAGSAEQDAALAKAFDARLADVLKWMPPVDRELIVPARVSVPMSIRYDTPTELSVLDDEPVLR